MQQQIRCNSRRLVIADRVVYRLWRRAPCHGITPTATARWEHGAPALLLERRCQLQPILCDIEDDASPAGLLLCLQSRKGHGNVLLADTEDTADIDNGRCNLPVRPLQEPFDRAEALTRPAVDSLIGVVTITRRDPIVGRLGEKADWRDDVRRVSGADRPTAAIQQVPEKSCYCEQRQ